MLSLKVTNAWSYKKQITIQFLLLRLEKNWLNLVVLLQSKCENAEASNFEPWVVWLVDVLLCVFRITAISFFFICLTEFEKFDGLSIFFILIQQREVVAKNFRRHLTSKLRRLIAQDKLEKVNRYMTIDRYILLDNILMMMHYICLNTKIKLLFYCFIIGICFCFPMHCYDID